jgi:hypothetical protein
MRLRLKFKEFKFIFLCLVLIAFKLASNLDFFSNQFDVLSSLKINNGKVCGKLPEAEKILRDNTHWQILKTPKRIVKLFNAYLDSRPEKSVVRMTLLTTKLDITEEPIYCQLWFQGRSYPTVVKATELFLAGQESMKARCNFISMCFLF